MALIDRMGAGSFIWSALWASGMVLVYLGERIIAAGTGRGVFDALGLGLVLAAVLVRAVRRARVAPDRRPVEGWLLGLHLVGIGALLLYFLQSDVLTAVAGHPLEHRFPKLATVLAVLWPALWAGAAMPILMVELSYAGVMRAPQLEVRRVREAMLTGVGLVCALVFAFSAVYAATGRDKKIDLAYFRTTRPGESTTKIVRTLTEPLKVTLFFPPGNDVAGEVKGYFQDLAKESKLLQLADDDFDLNPVKAREQGVYANGAVLFTREGKHENLTVPLELAKAHGALKTLDREAQQRFIQVLKPRRTMYFTQGHDERPRNPEPDSGRAGLRDMRDLLVDQGIDIRELSAAEGLASEIPADAAAVAVVGPQKAFLPEEQLALARYVERGGRLLLALDPEAGIDMSELLGPLGVRMVPELLANDDRYARKSGQISDRANLVTATYSSHPSVTNLGKLGARAPMFLLGAGHLELLKKPASEVTVNTTLWAMPSTFNDVNHNYELDAAAKNETRRGWELAAAISRKRIAPAPAAKDDAAAKDAATKDAAAKGTKAEKKDDEGRVIVVADSDLLSDGVIRIPGNALFTLDGVRWLLGEEAWSGPVNNESDVPITQTRKQDMAWFYTSTFLAPALVIGAGLVITRRRRGRPAVRPQGGAS